MKERVFCLIFLFFITSCQIDVEEFLIEDDWSIIEIYYEDENVKSELMTNSIFFEENNICKLPFIYFEMDKEDWIGKWSYNKSAKKLTIEGKNPYLNDKFDICFEKNTEYKRIVLVLTSDKIHLKAVKGSTTYRGNGGKLPISCIDTESK